jgi:hypothetical protein
VQGHSSMPAGNHYKGRYIQTDRTAQFLYSPQ